MLTNNTSAVVESPKSLYATIPGLELFTEARDVLTLKLETCGERLE